MQPIQTGLLLLMVLAQFVIVLATGAVKITWASQTEDKLTNVYEREDAIEAFEQARTAALVQFEETAAKLSPVVEQARAEENSQREDAPQEEANDASGSRPVMVELSEFVPLWESEWEAARAQFETLEVTFSGADKQTQDYFADLDALAEEIHDPAIRLAQAETNRQLKRAWTAAYAQAAQDFATLQTLVQAGDDTRHVLMMERMRGTSTVDIEPLQAMLSQAQELLVQLEQLTHAGRQLTSEQQIPEPRPERSREQGT